MFWYTRDRTNLFDTPLSGSFANLWGALRVLIKKTFLFLPKTRFRPAAGTLIVLHLLCATANGGDRPFDMPANWGGTGLMEIPTARVLPDGAMRLGVAKASPYIWYSFGFGALPGLEFTGRYTDVTNISGGLEPEFGSFKDKAFDIKYQVFPESKHTPAIAVGWNDFQGTRLFESQYLTVSRQIYPLDLTLGVGRQRFKGSLDIDDEIGLWAGVECAVTERLHLMLEYNPIEYDLDPLPARGVPQGSNSPINVGMRYRTWFGMDLALTYQRGDTLGAAAHLQFDLGKPILPPKPDSPAWGFAAPPDTTSADRKKMRSRLAGAIEKAGFTDIKVYCSEGEIIAEFENHRYLSNSKAAGRVIRLLLQYAGENTEHLTAVLKRRGLKLLYVSVTASDARRYFMGDLPEEQFARKIIVIQHGQSKDGISATTRQIAAEAQHQAARRRLAYGIDPLLESFFNDPTGVYHGRLSLRPYATVNLWPGAALHGSYDIPLYSDVASTAEIPSNAVRSDAFKYLGTQSAVNRLLIDQIANPIPLTYARFTAGYLERMYAGAGGELLRYLHNGLWAVGIEVDWVYKRQPYDALNVTTQFNHTLLGNLYYCYRPLDITLKAQAGRFLAGDTGLRMEFRRRFQTGARIGFWYSWTDTDHLTGFNRGYNDKGLSLTIPFGTFTDHPTRKMLHYSISPWTRDVGATIDHWQEIYDTTSDMTPFFFNRDLGRFDR